MTIQAEAWIAEQGTTIGMFCRRMVLALCDDDLERAQAAMPPDGEPITRERTEQLVADCRAGRPA